MLCTQSAINTRKIFADCFLLFAIFDICSCIILQYASRGKLLQSPPPVQNPDQPPPMSAPVLALPKIIILIIVSKFPTNFIAKLKITFLGRSVGVCVFNRDYS